MPCSSDYLEPTESERNSKKCARHINYIAGELTNAKQFDAAMNEFDVTADDIIEALNSVYGYEDELGNFVQTLCKLCTNMSDEQQEKIIYNGRNLKARQLAIWWDEHQEADRIKRIEQETVELVESKEYQLRSAISVARGRLENGATISQVLDRLEEEMKQIMNGEILFEN